MSFVRALAHHLPVYPRKADGAVGLVRPNSAEATSAHNALDGIDAIVGVCRLPRWRRKKLESEDILHDEMQISLVPLLVVVLFGCHLEYIGWDPRENIFAKLPLGTHDCYATEKALQGVVPRHDHVRVYWYHPSSKVMSFE